MKNLPKNIAIIMDGNRRWAKDRCLPIIKGHKRGSDNLRRIVTKCKELGVEELTVFAFSTENWNRVPSEVSSLLNLIERFLKSEVAELNKNNIRFNIIGEKNKFSNSMVKLLDYAETITEENDGMVFNVSLNYGGKLDILHAVKKIVNKVDNNELCLNDINENTVRENLLSSRISDVDLIIRTSGEQRISNFLFWQLAYSEFYFSPVLWPEFDENELTKAIDKYSERDRRYGISKQL